jgi:hypothetical protein
VVKFFREIRRSLLIESKRSRYFQYALGEIVLMVVVILIALQINKWNGAVRQSEEELLALKDLRTEFQSNEKDMKDIIQKKKEAE